jgi:hypothetical protein
MAKQSRSTSSARLKRAPLSVAALLTKLKLQYGLMSAEKAVEWARARGSVLEDPPYFLHEMASMSNPSARQLAAVLDDAMAGTDEVPALRMLLGGLHGPLNRNPKVLAKLAGVLALICDVYGPELPEDMRDMDSYSDRLEREGAASAPTVREEMLAFLGRYRGLL